MHQMSSAGQSCQRRHWKEPIGRLGLVGQGVVATIIGLIAIRIAVGDKDQAATSEGAVAWLADQPFGKFLLVALTVALFALALWRFLCAGMGDPVEGSEPKDRLSATYRGHCRPGTGAGSRPLSTSHRGHGVHYEPGPHMSPCLT